MGFVWIQNIAIGADIDSVDIVEIRDAADFVLDNLCLPHNVAELAGENGLHLIAEDGVENSDHNPALDGAENSDDNLALDGVENSDHNPALDDTANSDDNPAEDGTVDSADNLLLDGTDFNSEDGSALGANQSPDNTGVDYLEEATDHGPNWWTTYPTAVLDEYGSGDDSAAQSNV